MTGLLYEKTSELHNGDTSISVPTLLYGNLDECKAHFLVHPEKSINTKKKCTTSLLALWSYFPGPVVYF